MRQFTLLATKVVSVSALVGGMYLFATTDSAEAKTAAPTGHTFTGYSHHYGDHLHGRRTASGQAHDKFKLTAAHKSLPFGTHLHVTNTRNGKSCVVVVNDRGPYGSPSLVLDVSKAAAHALGFPGGGKIPITAKVIDPKSAAEALKSSEQIASVKNYRAANGVMTSVASAVTKTAVPKIESKNIAQLPDKLTAAVKTIAVVPNKDSKTIAMVPAKGVEAVKTLTVQPSVKPQPTPVKVAVVSKATTPAEPQEGSPASNSTFLLVINESLEVDKAAQPAARNADYDAAARSAAHYAPTVFIPMDQAQPAVNTQVKKPATARLADNILM